MDSRAVSKMIRPVRVMRLGSLGLAIAVIGLSLASLRWGVGSQIGIGGRTLLPAGLFLLLFSLALWVKPIQTWMECHERVLSIALVWLTILAPGVVGAELYARHLENYWLFSLALRPTTFSNWTVVELWNRRVYEENPAFFAYWPVPLELYDSDKPRPIFLLRPNLRMALHGSELVPAKPGEPVYWSSDSWGFRGPEFSVEKPPGVIRIVCVGASTTEGVYSADNETYPYYLQQELNRLFPNLKFEVINAGHHGYGLDSILELFKQRVLPLNPDVVIFYMGGNTGAKKEFLKGTSCVPGYCWLEAYPSWYRWLSQYSALFLLFSKTLHLPDRQLPPMPHQFDDKPPKPISAEYIEGVRQIVRAAQDHHTLLVLSSFVTLAHDGLDISYQDSRFLFEEFHLIWYPFTPGEVAQYYDYFNRAYAQMAMEYGTPFADVAAEFPKDMRYFPFDELHLSPEGNRVLAGLFAKFLTRQVIPELASK